MLTKTYVDEVIVQADYMSGDRNTIASALRVHQRLGVVILAAPGHLKTAQDLESLYKGAAGANRVAIHQVAFSSGKPEDAVKGSYKMVDRYVHGKGKAPNWINPTVDTKVTLQSATYGTRVVGDKFRANAVGSKTQLRQFWRLDKVQAKTGGRTQDLQPAMNEWLKNKGFREDRAYVFLFTKQAAWSMKEDKRGPGGKLRVAEDRWAEKAHHFTSILTWRILQERIERETHVIPVAAGDDIGLNTTPTLVQFWEKDDWKKLLANVIIDQRSAQLGMWCYLAEWLKSLSIIGMRSGMIEVPALLGIRTLYLEEKHNEQAVRMQRWIGTVPTFERQIVNVAPGIKQQVYWKDQSLQSREPIVAQHAVNQGGHLAQVEYTCARHPTVVRNSPGNCPTCRQPLKTRELSRVVMGFGSKDLAKKQPGALDGNDMAPVSDYTRKNYPKLNQQARDKLRYDAMGQALARAVFGTTGLGQAIRAIRADNPSEPSSIIERANKFTLEKDEFNSIIEWINKTPKPSGATGAVYGSIAPDSKSVTGGKIIDCKKQDEIHQKLMSERNIKTWSEYLASEEYLKSIGIETEKKDV